MSDKRQVAAQAAIRGVKLETPVGENAEEKVTDVADAGTQHRILHPKATELKLSYTTLYIYPPSIAFQRRIFNYITKIVGDATSKPGAQNQNVLAMRFSEEVTIEENENALLNLTIQCLDEPGKMSLERGEKLFIEMKANVNSDDLTYLFNHFFEVSGIKRGKKSLTPDNGRK